jgi:hypothetical protein
VTWARHGHGMTSVNQTRPHCVNQMGKTHSKPLAAWHGRRTAWARHAMWESALREPHRSCQATDGGAIAVYDGTIVYAALPLLNIACHVTCCTVFDFFCTFFWGHVLPTVLLYFISLFIIFFCLVVFLLLGDSPAPEFYVPTFRKTPAFPSSQVTRPQPMKKEQDVSKRLHTKFRRRGITQKKAYSIQNTAKVWNWRIILTSFIKTLLSLFIAVSLLLLFSLSCFPFSLSRPDPHCDRQYYKSECMPQKRPDGSVRMRATILATLRQLDTTAHFL